jgi:hypothetical protein
MARLLRVIGFIVFLVVTPGCGKPNPQKPDQPTPIMPPHPYPPPPDPSAIPGEVHPGDVDVTEDGIVIFSTSRATYISGYQDGWRECCNLHMRGQLDLNDERVEAKQMEQAPEGFNEARKEGFKACRQVLKQRFTQ